MKKIYFMLAAAVLTAACAKEIETVQPEETGEGLVDYTFAAGQDASKTTFNGTDFVWTPGDRISVFDSSLKNRRFETQDSGVSGTFVGRAKESSTFYAIYPYDAAMQMTEAGIVKVNIPSSQTVSAGTITDGVNLSMGKIVNADPASISGKSFLMRNIGGYIKFNLGQSANPITQVNVVAPGGETISGDVKVDYTGELPVTTASGGAPVIGLTSTEGNFKAGTYFAVVNPVALSSGLKLTLVRGDDYSAEIPIDCAAIVRNSAKATTFDIADPDNLEWRAPERDVLHVAFIDPTTENLKFYQPFEEALPATGTPDSKLQQGYYHLKETGEEFFISTTCLTINSGSGIRLDKDGYITLPAIPGKKLEKITVTYGQDKQKSAQITLDEDGAPAVAGGEEIVFPANAKGTAFSWTLAGSLPDTKYRIVATKDGDCRFQYIDLEYVGRNKALVSSVDIKEAKIANNTITVSAALKTVHPESGFISWGVEYREENETEWTVAQTGTGTDISVTIENVSDKKVWYVRVYGRADAGENVYSEEIRLEYKEPVVVTINKFSNKQYNGTDAGGYWKYIGTDATYKYPTTKAVRPSVEDSYAYYAAKTDTEPLISGIKMRGSSNAYYFTNDIILHYGGGYFEFPGKDGYKVAKFSVTIFGSTAGKDIVVTTVETTGISWTSGVYKSVTGGKLLGKDTYTSTTKEHVKYTFNISGDAGKGIRLWGGNAFNYEFFEITYE